MEQGLRGSKGWRKHKKTTVALKITHGVKHSSSRKDGSSENEYLPYVALDIYWTIHMQETA